MAIPHEWLFPSSTEEAHLTQRLLASKVSQEDFIIEPRFIGGMDVSNNLYDPQEMIYASTVSLTFPELKLLSQTGAAFKQQFPYIPGLLGFREAPALVEAFKNFGQKELPYPHVWMVDGHGVSHPRGLGIASHIGVLLDIPTIGVAKSILVGRPAEPLGLEAGSTTALIWKNKTIGILLRTKLRCNPLIISAGHKISLQTALALVQKTLRGYRLPEPTRHAHLAANMCRKSHLETPASV